MKYRVFRSYLKLIQTLVMLQQLLLIIMTDGLQQTTWDYGNMTAVAGLIIQKMIAMNHLVQLLTML